MHLAAQRVGASTRDHRVEAVLDVLGGDRVYTVASRSGLESVLLQRWVRAFVDAGTAAVTNQPDDELARSRDRFLAAFAHELRTPLAVAQGWSAVLEDGGVDPEDLELAGVRVAGALRRLHERVRDVELLAAASLGRLRVSQRPFPAAELLRNLDGAAYAVGSPCTEMEGDPELLGRVVRDLWTAAALEPAPVSRHVEVSVNADWAELRVVRAGAPLSHLRLQALFDPFDVNEDDTGITIGLYLARALVVAHRGTLGVEQDDERALFWVRLPRTPASSTPPDVTTDAAEGIGRTEETT